MAIINENPDAPGNTTTGFYIGLGDNFRGTLEHNDYDWVEIKLFKGKSYSFFVDGYGSPAASDPIVTLYDSSGNHIDLPEWGSISPHNSLIRHSPEATGTFYLQVKNYVYYLTGGYELSYQEKVTAPTPPPVYTLQQVANQLTTDYWVDHAGTGKRAWNVSNDNIIKVNISGLTPAAKKMARAALDLWEGVSGLKFKLVNSGGQIIFDDKESGAETHSEFNNGTLTKAEINIGPEKIAQTGAKIGSYTFYLFIHELGHALGLGHSGNYNHTAKYAQDGTGNNNHLNDSWLNTVMSYFTQDENTWLKASYGVPISPMMADILAIQKLYPTLTPKFNEGKTIYDLAGKGTAKSFSYVNANNSMKNVFTIFDTGGIDTFDASGTAKNQKAVLQGGEFWNIGGRKDNVGIAKGTVIENFKGGSGDDKVTGNSKRNVLIGNDGEDTLKGRDGKDKLVGGKKTDHLFGGQKKDTLNGGSGQDFLNGGKGNDTLIAGPGNKDKLTGGPGEDTFVFGPNEGVSLILDFDNGADLIDLRKFKYKNKAEALSHFKELGTKNDDKVAFVDQGTKIGIKGADLKDIDASDLII